jgi:DMSO/TMAO reductase YedYZ molybdopterin-dependent catalytic subunit
MGGVAAAAVAVGLAQLVAVPFGPDADVRTAVGSSVIELTPGPLKEWAIQTFGTADKLFLTVAVLVVVAALAAVAGMVESRPRPYGSAMIVAAGVIGGAAVLSRPGAGPLDLIPTAAGVVGGVAVLRLLTSRRFDDRPAAPVSDAPVTAAPDTARDPGRRRSLVTLGMLGVGAVSGVAGVVLTRLTSSVAGDRDAYALPSTRSTVRAVPPAVQPPGVQLPPFLTPNDEFYRIDTALSVPQLSRAAWKLRIHGMVDREVTYTFADLERFPLVDEVVTLTCVSNPVGGNLISNARWTGYRVRDLLAAAGVQPSADMVLSMSVDGFTAGTPVEALQADKALLAVGMNGVPLPIEHGYPARLVVPGLYGYVSATKWVVDLELTRFDRAEAYWTRLGWSARGPIKTESRIDVPRAGADVAMAPTTFGGVAWAQGKGIRGVEVKIDTPAGEGQWQPATLGASYSNDTWRLWSAPFTPRQTGFHTITVRATDNTGYTQTPDRAEPVPDGATGWHSITFAVR